MEALVLVALVGMAYAVFSAPLSRSPITGPMVFTGAGWLIHQAGI